jgi:hypothetical protein
MESLSYFGLKSASPSSMTFAVDPQLQSFHHGHQVFATVKLKMYTNGEIGINVNTYEQCHVGQLEVYSNFEEAVAPRDNGSHLSPAFKSTDTGTPYINSASGTVTTQGISVSQGFIVMPHSSGETPQGYYQYSLCFITIPPNNHTVLCDPSGHSVIPIPYQNHEKSFTECSCQSHAFFAADSILKSTHFTFEPNDCETVFASSHLLDTNNLSLLICVPCPSFDMVGKKSNLGNGIALEVFGIWHRAGSSTMVGNGAC